MAKVILLCLFCCFLAICSGAQEHFYFRLIVEDSGKQYTVRAEDILLMDSGKGIHPVASKYYPCLDAELRNNFVTLTVQLQSKRTLVVPKIYKWRLFGEQWVLKINPLASDSFWTATWPTDCGTGQEFYGHCPISYLYSELSTCPVNEIETTTFMHRTRRVDYYGQPIYFVEGADNPEFQRPHNTRFTPSSNATDMFLGPKPSEYYNLWPEY